MAKYIHTIYRAKNDINGNSRSVAVVTELSEVRCICGKSNCTTITIFGCEGFTPPLFSVQVPNEIIEITPSQYTRFKKIAESHR